MYTLLIVDPQYDFIEDGKLPVKGGKEALDNVAKFINNHASEISDIIVTKDWHKADHCSFKAFGGKFPEHCIAESFGAKVYIPIQDAIRNNNIYVDYLHKGYNKEAFTAFRRIYHNYNNAISYEIQNAEQNDKSQGWTFSKHDNIVICGLAGDICVLNTMKILKDLNLTVYKEGIASLDGGETLDEYCKNNNIKYYDD